ncbi:alpha/beta fold hydrolase [uncultured Porticoccus sp.]|uniref:YheT family hydrolase n=1 Tax=Porticoccus sp. TaxID=2024853 RepID=UPI0030DDDE4C|tara:strand:+ start:1761 stop:2762 length:1002 start_codon:yes stop_codon:yes gene_type:complete
MHLQLTDFCPPAGLRNAHLQSLLSNTGPRQWLVNNRCLAMKARSKTLLLNGSHDGQAVKLLAAFDRADRDNNKLAVLLHGWEGSGESTYILSAAHYLYQRGFNVLRLNLRDHGGSLHLNSGTFNSTLSEEVATAIMDFLRQQPHRHCSLAGYSLGGNFALRIAADVGTEIPLSSVVAICPPVDPAHAMERIMDGPLYRNHFFDKWTRSLEKKLYFFPDLLNHKPLPRFSSLTALNDFFVPAFTPFSDASQYFSAYALSGDRLSNLSVPAYLITSEDDPIVPVADLEKIHRPDALTFVVTALGGHCGFIENYRLDCWIDRCLAEIFNYHPFHHQ